MAAVAAKTIGRQVLKSPTVQDIAFTTITGDTNGSTPSSGFLPKLRRFIFMCITLIYAYVALVLTGLVSGTCVFGILGVLFMHDFLIDYLGYNLIPFI